MQTVKEKVLEIIKFQPDDISYEEIIREIAFNQMIERGLDDSRKGRIIYSEEMNCRIKKWFK